MKDLAVVLISCDKYSWIWDTWYYYFKRNWDIDCPVYFLNETKKMYYPDIKQILINEPNPNKWTKRVRLSINQIPEQNLFIILDDMLFDMNITDTFKILYDIYKQYNADALRVRAWDSSANMVNLPLQINGYKLKLLRQNSNYLITFSPNIWNKDYLLKCLRKNQSIWKVEMSNRMKRTGCKVYDYPILGWCVNAVKQGEVTKQGQKKIDEIIMDRDRCFNAC